MSDLIDRQALCDDLREYKVHPVPISSDESEVKGYNDGIDLAISVISGFPFAEPERKTGRWVLWNGPWSEYVKCTACGEMYDQDDLYIGGNDYPKFCPNCGAKME